jgi:hypothetical protein
LIENERIEYRKCDLESSESLPRVGKIKKNSSRLLVWVLFRVDLGCQLGIEG